MIVKNKILKLLKEELTKKYDVNHKVANIIKEPYVLDLNYNFNITDEKQIVDILKIVYGGKKIKIIGLDNGGDIYIQPIINQYNGPWVYYEAFDGTSWEKRVFDSTGKHIRTYGFDGDQYFDNEIRDLNIEL